MRVKDKLAKLYKEWSDELKIKCPNLICKNYPNPLSPIIALFGDLFENREEIL